MPEENKPVDTPEIVAKVVEEFRVVEVPEERTLEDRIKDGARILRAVRGLELPGAPPTYSYVLYEMSDGGEPVKLLFADALNRCRVIINSLSKVIDGGHDRDGLEQDMYITSETLRVLREILDGQEDTGSVLAVRGLIQILDRSLLELSKTWRDRKEGFRGGDRPQAGLPDCPDW